MAPGHRVGQQPRDRLRRVHDHLRSRGGVDADADPVGQQVPRHDLRPRVGAGRVARRRQAVAATRGQGRLLGARRARRGQAQPADHVDRRHGHDHRSGVPRDRQAVPREPRSARRRVRPGLVQAAPPRHGPGHPLRRPAGTERAAALAGQRPRSRGPADRRRRDRRAEVDDPRLRADDRPARQGGVGGGGDLPHHRLPRRRQRRPHPPVAAGRVGRQRAGRRVDDASPSSRRSSRRSTARAVRRSRSPT